MSLDPAEAKQIVSELITKAWEEAGAKGVPNDVIASTALTAALSSLVHSQGQEATAAITKRILEAVMGGKFGH